MKKHKLSKRGRFVKMLKKFTLEDLFYLYLKAISGKPDTEILTPEMVESLDAKMEELDELYPFIIRGVKFSENIYD